MGRLNEREQLALKARAMRYAIADFWGAYMSFKDGKLNEKDRTTEKVLEQVCEGLADCEAQVFGQAQTLYPESLYGPSAANERSKTRTPIR